MSGRGVQRSKTYDKVRVILCASGRREGGEEGGREGGEVVHDAVHLT